MLDFYNYDEIGAQPRHQLHYGILSWPYRGRSPANVCMKSFTCIVKTVSLGELCVLPKDTVLYSA